MLRQRPRRRFEPSSRLTRSRQQRSARRSRQLLLEQLEDRRLLFFHNTGLGGLACEATAESGRLIMQAAAQRTSDLSLPGERLPAAYRDAVVQTMRNELGDTVANSMAATLDKVWVHWNSTLTDTDIFGGIDIGSAKGKTFGHHIYLEYARPNVAYNRTLSDLILHEIVHARQFENYGSSLSNFGYHYFKKWCQAGFSYRGNDLEEDAHGFESAYGAAVYEALWPATTINVTGARNQTDAELQVVNWEVSGRLSVVAVELQRRSGNTWSRVSPHSVEHHVSHHSFQDLSGGFNFEAAGLGQFRLAVSATQESPNPSGTGSSAATTQTYYPSAQGFEVRDDDTTGPMILLSGIQSTVTDAAPRVVQWNTIDSSGISSVTAQVIRSGVTLLNSHSVGGSLDFTSYGPGTYEFRVTATDNDQDRPDDKATSTLTRVIIVQDDDESPPAIAFTAGGAPLVGTGQRQSHGLRNAIGWTVSDYSGVDLVTASVWRDNQFLGTFQKAASDEILLDPYDLGVFPPVFVQRG